MYITKEQENMQSAVEAEKETGIHRRVWAVYHHYLTLSEETKNQIQKLYSLKESKKADSFRVLLNRSEHRTKVDVDEFLAVTMVFNFNALEERVEGSAAPRHGTAIYAAASKFAHSCFPNCAWNSDGEGWCTVRAIRSIAPGEEMTFNHYDADFVAQPTHLRRAYLRRSKEISCDCPRCASPGDDTRQFSCAIVTCPGRHFTSQPTIDSNVIMLPCTVCSASPTLEYQTLMFYREKTQAAVVRTVLEEIRLFPAKLPVGTVAPSPREIQEMDFLSPHHYLTHYLAKIKKRAYESVGDRVRAAEMMDTAVRAAEAFLKFPSLLLADTCLEAAEAHEELGSRGALLVAKQYCQEALRISKALYGDAERRTRFQAPLVRVLGKRMASFGSDDRLDISAKVKECTFCGCRPTAALGSSLRRCAGCKRVAYCGIVCQKSHWPTHQPVCVKPAPVVPAVSAAGAPGVAAVATVTPTK